MSIKVLLADPHSLVRQGLYTLLSGEKDIEVVAEAEDGQATISLTQKLSPHVVVMDVTMPDVSAIDITRRVLANSPAVKIIALSTHADRRFALNMLKTGASAFLLKDCVFEELARAVREVAANKTYLGAGVSELVIKEYIMALRESETRSRAIFEGATTGIALLDLQGRLVESNPALQEMLGFSREELRNLSFTMVLPPDEGVTYQKLLQQLVKGNRTVFTLDSRLVPRHGRMIWGRFTVSLVKTGTGENQFAVAMVENLTPQREAEEKIRNYQEQLRSLASQLSLAEERERRILATELHDHIGQILALTQIKLGSLRDKAANTDLEVPVNEVRDLVEQVIKSTRSLTFEISPPILYELGLEAALEWFGEHLQEQHGILVDVRTDAEPKPLGNETRVLLFKVVRELMLNSVKHGRANNLRVVLGRDNHNLTIEVADDGVGFTPTPSGSEIKTGGFGLFSIRERLQHLDGRLQVDSAPGQGTRVSLLIPLWAEEKELQVL
ncbi:MAG: PAS domain S-box protein [Thermodesulfobacteriota bacterium]